MTDKTKLVLALMQVENISHLIVGNRYEGMLTSHLLNMKFELKRQLRCIDAGQEIV